MAELVDIPEDEEVSYNKGAAALYGLIKEVLPDHHLVDADAEIPTNTDPYITLAPMMVSGFTENGLGNKPIYSDVLEDGRTTKVYQERCTWRLRSYMDNAFFSLKRVKSALEQPEPHYRWFGVDGVIGVTSIGMVRRTPSIIDFQKVQNSATMLVSLTYLHKTIDTTALPINRVEFITETSISRGSEDTIVDNIIIEAPPLVEIPSPPDP